MRSERQLTLDLIRKATPGRRVRDRAVGGGPTDYDELRERLNHIYRAQNVVALVIDDAQRLSNAGLQFACDLMATKEGDPHRTVKGKKGSEAPAVGVAVVLVGTTDLDKRVIDTGDD